MRGPAVCDSIYVKCLRHAHPQTGGGGAVGRGGGGAGVTADEDGASSLGDDSVLERDGHGVWGGCTALGMYEQCH